MVIDLDAQALPCSLPHSRISHHVRVTLGSGNNPISFTVQGEKKKNDTLLRIYPHSAQQLVDDCVGVTVALAYEGQQHRVVVEAHRVQLIQRVALACC